jgi:hypothetical protein
MAATPLRVFISYSQKDEKLRKDLETHLASLQRQKVIHSWHDRMITVGSEWAGAIDENLNAADIILMLISANFLASDYCNDKELKRAMERHQLGEARVIPIILKPSDWITTRLGELQALPNNLKAVTTWSNRDQAFLEITQGIRQVALEMEAIRGQSGPPDRETNAESFQPEPLAPKVTCAAAASSGVIDREAVLEIPEGPVRIDSPFYIHPAEEGRCCAELDMPGALIRIKSPKGFGKTSLTTRLLAHASSKGYRTVSINLYATDHKFFEDIDLFMQWFCAAVGKGLGLRVRTEDYWDDIFGANDNSSDYFETYLLKPNTTPLLLAIDDFDQIFAHAAIETDFCGLLRSWHERARSTPLWECFRLLLSHSQESYLQKDINQSPFNVGLPVELAEFSPEQVGQLLELHGLSLAEKQLDQLLELVGGHPYLVRKALYELANGLPFASFLKEAPTEAGVFSDHLRGLLRAVEDRPELVQALRQVVHSGEPVMLRSEEAFKLESLGLLVPEGNLERPRCRLYTQYMADRLKD